MPSTTYIVKPGDCLSSIAADHGFKDWTSIYHHPDNAALKDARKDPNLLAPGDKVIIPEKDAHSENRATGSRHKFKVDSEDIELRIVLKDSDDKPLANKKYKLTVDGKDFSGSTDGSGLLKQKLHPTARKGQLKIFLDGGPNDKGTFFPLSIGGLDPVEKDTGVLHRLHNLGYHVDPDDADSLASTLKAFQKKYKLTENGKIDQPTRDKLKNLHDGT